MDETIFQDESAVSALKRRGVRDFWIGRKGDGVLREQPYRADKGFDWTVTEVEQICCDKVASPYIHKMPNYTYSCLP